MMQPDYGCSMFEAQNRFASAAIESSGSLNILRFVEHQEQHFRLPSWAPRWHFEDVPGPLADDFSPSSDYSRFKTREVQICRTLSNTGLLILMLKCLPLLEIYTIIDEPLFWQREPSFFNFKPNARTPSGPAALVSKKLKICQRDCQELLSLADQQRATGPLTSSQYFDRWLLRCSRIFKTTEDKICIAVDELPSIPTSLLETASHEVSSLSGRRIALTHRMCMATVPKVTREGDHIMAV